MPKHGKSLAPRALNVIAVVVAAAISLSSASPADATYCTGPGYNASQLLDATHGVLLEWSACGARIDFQLSASTTGWVELGWGEVPLGGGDVVRGHVVSGIPTIEDTHFVGFFGWGHTVPVVDSHQDLSDTGGSEGSGVTTIRFSRLLDTGDTAEDVSLSLAPTMLTVMINLDTDDFSQLVFSNVWGASVSVDLSQGAAHRVVPEPTTLALLALGLAGLAGVACRGRRRA